MKKIFLGLTLIAFFSACTSKQSAENKDTDNRADAQTLRDSALNAANNMLNSDSNVIETKGGISLTGWINSKEFNDAKIKIISPENDKVLNPGKVAFQYKLENYTLSVPTPGSEMCGCANSAEGQHIHLILNNEPYTAHYTDTFTKNLTAGHYVNLSFLSRSYHESIKNKDAYTLTQFSVGKQDKNADIDLKAPMLFYSRPKGEYKGDDTKNILLDFYLVNTDLSANGNKVRATINGNEFILNAWKPYGLKGLPMGENTIKLELIDQNNKLIEGPYNSVTRKITLKD